MELKKTQGYTLIELIIVIAMMLGLTTVMVLNGTDSRHLANLENAARQLESALTEAQAYGNSGRAFPPESTDLGAFDRGYGVFVSPADPDKILIYGGMGASHSPDEEKYAAGRSQEHETIQLEGSVVISEIKGKNPSSAAPQGVSILFRRGQQSVYVFRHSNNDNLDGCEITLESGGFTKIVHVFSSGLIYTE